MKKVRKMKFLLYLTVEMCLEPEHASNDEFF